MSVREMVNELFLTTTGQQLLMLQTCSVASRLLPSCLESAREGA